MTHLFHGVMSVAVGFLQCLLRFAVQQLDGHSLTRALGDNYYIKISNVLHRFVFFFFFFKLLLPASYVLAEGIDLV